MDVLRKSDQYKDAVKEHDGKRSAERQRRLARRRSSPRARSNDRADHRPEQQDERQRGDRADQPVRPEHAQIALGADHRQPERVLGAAAEHQRQRERRERNADLLEHVADDAEAPASARCRTSRSGWRRRRSRRTPRSSARWRRTARAGSTAKIGTVVSTMTRPTTLPRYIEAIRPQTKSLCSTNSSGPGLRPHTIRPPSRIAAVPEPGMPSASIGSSADGARGVRRGLRREHALDAALAEAFRVLGEALGEVVAHERRRDRAARRDAEPAADRRRAQQRHPVARQVLPHARARRAG